LLSSNYIQADFSFFFDTSGKRKCYLAPERFYDSLNTPAPPSALTPAMDVFSAGCVIAELFADGDALFDYSRLLAYRRGDYDPGDFLKTKCGLQIAEIIAHMIQTDPQARASAGEYALMLASRTLDPAIIATFHPFLASLLQTPDASHRARCVVSEYEGLKSLLTGASDLGVDHPLISNAPHPQTQDKTDQVSCFEASIDTPKPALDDVFAETPVSNLYDEAMQMIADVKAVLSTIDKEPLPVHAASLKNDSRPSMQPTETQVPQDYPPPDTKDTSKSSVSNNDNRLQGLGLLLGVLCATMRGARHESGRVKFVHFIADCAVNCGDDELRLQTAIPRLMSAATDSSFAAVRCAALASIPKVLGCVCRFPPGEIRSFADYLLPLLSLLPTDADVAVQTEYAATLGRLASIAHRVMDCDGETCDNVLVTAEERAALRAAIERSVHDILVGVHPDPKLALLPHVSQLAVVLGRRDTADGLLPALLTLFNAREWQVRAALYEHGLQGVCPTLGPASISFLLPFLDRMLSDPEPAAIAASLRLLTTLTDVGILGRRYILTAMKKVVGDCGLLSQPSNPKSQDPKQCTAVRTAALCFVGSASQALGPITTRALLLPILTPVLPSLDQLVRQGQGHEAALTMMDGASLARCLDPLAPSPAGSTGPFASPPPFATCGPARDHISRTDIPLVSYSVSIDPATFLKGASLLDSALTLVNSSKPSSDKMALMLAGAQRTLVNVMSEQQSQQSDTLQNERASGGPMSDHSSAMRERENAGASEGKGTSAEETRCFRPRGVLVAHLAQHRGKVNRILPLTKKGRLFLTASEDGCIKIWDVGRLERDISFRARASYQGHGHAGVHAAVVVGRDGNHTVASADSCGRVLFWSVNRLGGGPDSTVNEHYDQYQFDKRLNITDLGRWSADCIVVSVAGPGGGVVALDSRNPGNTSTSYDVASSNSKRSWQLPCDPADGAVICLSLGDPEPSISHWVVTATSRGVVALWDVRFLLPVVTWSIPTRARIEALAVKQGSTLTSAPTVYTAAGRNEISAWDVNRRSCVGVYRYNSNSSLTTATEQNPSTKSPEALSVATGSSLLARSMDPLAKGRLLGANELRSLPPRSPGVRALLLDDGPDSRLFAGGSDCAVRCWDLLNPTDHSYCVVAPPPAEPFTGPPMFEYCCKLMNEVPVVEEGCQLNRTPSSQLSSQRQQQREAQTWWERASGLCHKQTITAMARVEGHSEALLATASMDGVVKVWR
jgi:phosphoinositide-3-kinase regulatory subunit 4